MSLIEDVLSTQENYMSNKQRLARHQAEFRRIEEYEARDRLSVSSFDGMDCCIKALIASRKKPRYFAQKTLPKLSMGTALHEVWQKYTMDTPNLKMVKPWNFPYEDKEFTEKLHEIWPETPVRFKHPTTGKALVTGYLDDVICYYKDDVAVVDYKFPGCKPEIFKAKFEKEVLLPKYLFQIKYYLWRIQQDGYYLPLIPKYYCLYFVNWRFEAGDPDGEREVWGQLTDEDRLTFLEMEKEIVRLADDPTLECSYAFCKEHGKYAITKPESIEG